MNTLQKANANGLALDPLDAADVGRPGAGDGQASLARSREDIARDGDHRQSGRAPAGVERLHRSAAHLRQRRVDGAGERLRRQPRRHGRRGPERRAPRRSPTSTPARATSSPTSRRTTSSTSTRVRRSRSRVAAARPPATSSAFCRSLTHCRRSFSFRTAYAVVASSSVSSFLSRRTSLSMRRSV